MDFLFLVGLWGSLNNEKGMEGTAAKHFAASLLLFPSFLRMLFVNPS